MTNSADDRPTPAPDEEEFVFTDEELLGPLDPRDAPRRRATPGAAIARFFRSYGRFAGRSSRSEYWWVALFNAVVMLGLAIGAGVAGGAADRSGSQGTADIAMILGLLYGAYTLAALVPSLALGVRRLHDADLAGWFLLLGLIPGLGPVTLAVFAVLPPNQNGERFDRRTGAVLD